MTDSDPTHGPRTRAIEDALSQMRPPEHIDAYTILEVLGEGGMGTVYLAEDPAAERRVALKVIKPGMDSREVLRRFRYERRTLARMSHDAIAKVFHLGVTDQNLPYYVMEHVDGLPLDEYCDLWQLDLDTRLRLIQTICAGVQHAHDRGAVHRDLKPGNVLVMRQGDEHRPKVIDFGLALALEPDDAASRTSENKVLGTLEYMAPEQVAGDRSDVGVRTDIYALGVMLYQLLCGVLPFPEIRTRGMADRLRVIADDAPPSVGARIAGDLDNRATVLQVGASRLLGLARRELTWIVARAMHKDPRQRYATVTELARDLQRLLDGEAVTVGPDSAWYRMSKFLRRRRLESIAGIAVGASLVTAVVGIANSAEEAQASNVRSLMTTARMAQERGNWSGALATLADAEATGRVDPIEIAIGRVLAHVGAFDDRSASEQLQWLEQADVPPDQRAKVLLLRGMFQNRREDPGAGLDLVRLAVADGGLEGNEVDLADYLLADTFDDARAAIERAVARDPHDRLANLAKMSLLFCAGLGQDALEFGRKLDALYPRDQIGAVPLLLDGVLRGDPEVAETAAERLRSDDEEFADAVRQFATSARVLRAVDDQLVRHVFDDQEFGLKERAELAFGWTIPVVIKRFMSATTGDTKQRLVKTMGSVVPPCWIRGFDGIPKLVGLAYSFRSDKPSAKDHALIREVVREAADKTGLALFRFMSAYLYGMKGKHEAAIAEYERASKAGQLLPVPRSIDRGMLLSSYTLWLQADAEQRPPHAHRALTAIERLLPHARRDRAFEDFFAVAVNLGSVPAIAAIADRWRKRRQQREEPDTALRAAVKRHLDRPIPDPVRKLLEALRDG